MSAAPGLAALAAVPPVRPRSPGRSRAGAATPEGGAWGGSGWRWWPTSRPRAWRDSSAATSPGARPRRLGIHLVFGLAKRWLLGTHHGAVSKKHLSAYLDEFVFRFNRRTAKSLSHRFARVVEHAVAIPPTTYRALVAASA